MASAESSHPYHMVEPSKWPAVGSVAAFTMACGAIWYMHDGPPFVLLIGVAILLYTFYGWWRDVIRESLTRKYHTMEVSHGLRVGMLLFIASEVMFFVAFFWAFFNATAPFFSMVYHPVWPPEGIVPFNPWSIPFLNTLILLTSGATLTVAHHLVAAGDNKKAATWLLYTIILGLAFTGFQVYEYSVALFGLEDGIYASTFYLATGFHGFHVIVGTCFLIVCYFRARNDQFKADKHVGFESAAWYWHFVDVVWLFLFVSIYWWGKGSAEVLL